MKVKQNTIDVTKYSLGLIVSETYFYFYLFFSQEHKRPSTSKYSHTKEATVYLQIPDTPKQT